MSQKEKDDKIFDNRYNAGTLEDITDDEIELQYSYKDEYCNSEYNMEEAYRIEKLCDGLYDYIKGTKFEAIFQNRRIIKKVVPEILEFILPYLDKQNDYTYIEKFYVICEMLDIKGSIVYNNLPMHYKDAAYLELMKYAKVTKRQMKEKKNKDNDTF